MSGESFDIFDLEAEVGQIRTDLHRSAFVELANLDFLLAVWSLEKYQLRSARTFRAACYFKTEYVTVKADCLLEIRDAVAGVEELLDHAKIVSWGRIGVHLHGALVSAEEKAELGAILMRRWIRRIMRLAMLLMTAIVLVWLGCELAVEIAAWGRCYDRLDHVPARDTALVLGTSKYVAAGGPNLHYQYRMDAAAALFKAGKVRRLIVSGNGTESNYNEPRMMHDDLVARGVPADRIVLDEAGLRTFDSVVRAAEVFGAPACIVVSQPSHNERAIFIARTRGQDMIGWNARSVSLWTDPRTAIRERLARVLAVLDVTVLDKEQGLSLSGKTLSSTVEPR